MNLAHVRIGCAALRRMKVVRRFEEGLRKV
jgi:hypothetical protein